MKIAMALCAVLLSGCIDQQSAEAEKTEKVGYIHQITTPQSEWITAPAQVCAPAPSSGATCYDGRCVVPMPPGGCEPPLEPGPEQISN